MTLRGAGRPSSLTKIEEQRYVTLRNWDFSQREAGALARNLPRGRNGVRPPLGASTCQRLDGVHGPFAGVPKLPPGHDADSLRQLPERALVALADARGDVNSRKYLDAAGLRPVVKRAKRVMKSLAMQDALTTQIRWCVALPDESITSRAWRRACFVINAFDTAPTNTMTGRLAYVREFCRECILPVELDADARHHLTPWEQIAATWDGEFIADAARETLLLPFRNADHPKITPVSREAILAARNAMQSESPQSRRALALPSHDPAEWDEQDELIGIPADATTKQKAMMHAAMRAERQAAKRVMSWAGDEVGEWQPGPFDVDYGQG